MEISETAPLTPIHILDIRELLILYFFQKSVNRVCTDLELEKDQRQKWESEYDLLMKQCQQLHAQLRNKEQQLNEASQSYKSLELQCQAEIELTVSVE